MLKPIGYILGIGKRPYPTCEGAIITFGREAQNSVPLDDLMASRNHACIEVTATSVTIKDLGSFNGTFVNDQRLKHSEPLALKSGDAIRIGGKMFYFISEEAGQEPQKAAFTHSRDLSQKETLNWDGTYSAADEEVVVPNPAASPLTGLAAPLQTQRIKLNKTQPATLAGTLGGGSLPQIIQFIHSGAMTGRLQVNGNLLNGVILFLGGQLYAATDGHQEGAEAVYTSAQEHSGEFSFDRLEKSEIEKSSRNITDSTMHVIFECCRRTDESAKA